MSIAFTHVVYINKNVYGTTKPPYDRSYVISVEKPYFLSVMII